MCASIYNKQVVQRYSISLTVIITEILCFCASFILEV